MAQIYMKYNPYKLETELKVDGNPIKKDSYLYKFVKGKRLQEWVNEFPSKVRDETDSVDFDIDFCGLSLDFDDVVEAFHQAQESGLIKDVNFHFIKGKASEDVNEKIIDEFQNMQKGPVDDFRDPRLIKAFNAISSAVFPINVVATMSSGKSTLINALLGSQLMPSRNEACTAKITEVLDTDADHFKAVIFDKEGNALEETDDLTYEEMNRLNDAANVFRICAEGNIPFVESTDSKLKLIDTPGPNNSATQEHKNITYQAINSDSTGLILYVLNGTQLGTNDDHSLLEYVAEQMKKGGKQIHDRFLFVINKMDQFDPEKEDILEVLNHAREYLESFDIENPLIFPCSAATALNIRTALRDIDIDNLSRVEERKLSSAARDGLSMVDKLTGYENLFLEQYSTLTPSEKKALNFRLKKAEEAGNTKEIALIHSGIASIEAAISAYVTKYAKTKKVKDIVETFQEILSTNQIIAKAQMQVATDKQAAEEAEKAYELIKEKIDNAEDARKFREQIDALNPMPTLKEKADQKEEKARAKITRVFLSCGDTITNRDTAKALVKSFGLASSDAIAELSTEIESLVNNEVIVAGNKILIAYQDKLQKIDEEMGNEKLQFHATDIIKGTLATMQQSVERMQMDNFVAETIDDEDIAQTTTIKGKEYYVKVGQEEEKIVIGSHEEKIGTQKVKVGSHKVKTGTRTVNNPKHHFLDFLELFHSKTIKEDVYKVVDDYEERDITRTVLDTKTVLKDVYEKRTEDVEQYILDVSELQKKLVSGIEIDMDSAIKSALEDAEEQINDMKAKFQNSLDKLDETVKIKYRELADVARDEEQKRANVEKNENLCKWITEQVDTVNSIIEM